MHTVPQNKDKFTINKLFYCCEALIFTHPLVYEFLCGPKHMATPVHSIGYLSALFGKYPLYCTVFEERNKNLYFDLSFFR